MLFLINMIPAAQSGETNQDSEPALSVSPADPQRIAASAFTPDPGGGANAPIYVSMNGGTTWALNAIVPSQAGSLTGTGDITLAFGGAGTNLYAGILRIPGSLRLNILRTGAFTGPAAMTVLVDRNQVDQPFIRASRSYRGTGTGNDRVYAGHNDFGAAAGRTASVELSLDGGGATPPPPSNFTTARLETRNTPGQDSPQIRPAVHIDGTVYAIFHGRRNVTGILRIGDIVVVRDDNWAMGATPFSALTDPSDGLAGRIVATNVAVPWQNFSAMGQERTGGDLAIAVDPRNSDIVCICWADRPTGTTNYNLHVRRSTDRGQTWSATDLRTIVDAKNPALAINSRGRVAFSYQQLATVSGVQRWITHLETTDNGFATVTDTVMATVPANAPAMVFLPYIGDYLGMQAMGKEFYGVFSANNTPNLANFPAGITYQRNANFTTQTLFAVNGTTPVAPSIDPFFFREWQLPPESDVYVADWTDSATVFDLGVEPSIRPAFYTTSDVWNRHTNAPGGFDANNRPFNQDPKNGPGIAGRNWAFARIRRRGTGTAESVAVHFLTSEFGTGSNYQDAGTLPDPVINLAPGDAVITMANGYRWQLGATSSTHFCLAVEISTPNDPIVPPSLLGRAPGWPTTDLLVINDNNKAQRNMGVGPTIEGGWATRYALIHNAATYRRDLTLDWTWVGGVPEGARGARLTLVGGRPRELGEEGRIVLGDMLPGENRWIGVTIPAAGAKEGPAQVIFSEVVGTAAVNGFAIEASVLPASRVLLHLAELHGRVAARLAAGFGVEKARALASEARRLLEAKRLRRDAYMRFVRDGAPALAEMLEGAARAREARDPFGLRASLKTLEQGIASADLPATTSAHSELLEKADALMTMLQKAEGDTADVPQTLRWQIELCGSKRLARLAAARTIERLARAWLDAFQAREVRVDDYPRLVERLLRPLKRMSGELRDDALLAVVERMRAQVDSPARLEGAHRALLLRLSELV